MTVTLGSNNLLYEPVEPWESLPEGWSLVDAGGVAVDSKDQVYIFNRGEHPVVVLDREGNFLRSWGEGMPARRQHGIHIGPDDSVFCVDDGMHTIQKFTPEGKLLMTLGVQDQPTPRWQGQPFNRPTHIAVSPVTGNLYISDGYGNCRVHKFSPDGKHILSWGEPGIDPGQFNKPHSVVIDKDDNVYVADRENHRIQVFDSNGKFITMWNNIYKPQGICLDLEGNFIIGEDHGDDDCPGMGHRVSIYNLSGELLTRFGAAEEGEGPGQFIVPHGVAVDSYGDFYVAEVSYLYRKTRGWELPKLRRRVIKLARKR